MCNGLQGLRKEQELLLLVPAVLKLESRMGGSVVRTGLALMLLLLLLLLMVVTTFTDPSHSHQPTACLHPACFCTNATDDADHTTGHPGGVLVTCFLKSFSPSDSTLRTLTSDITSLKLVCSESSTRNVLTPSTFRQLEHLRHLVLERCFFAAVSSSALDAVPELLVLEVRECVFTEMPVDLFSPLVKLSRLTLTQCAVPALPRLCRVQDLQVLNVSGQNVMSMDQAVACGPEAQFEKLIIVDLSNNSLTELPRLLLEKATNLRELYVRDNRIWDLSLPACTKLEVVDVMGQELGRANFTGNNCSLSFKVLKLQGNGSLLFPVHILQGMSNLTTLHLENLGVEDVIWEVLPALKNLRHLALPANGLTSINLTQELSLLHLNLSRNAIAALDSGTFSSHRGLRVADLSWNNLTKVVGSTFSSLTLLHTLDLQHNRLALLLHSAVRHLPSLRRLLLSYNRLASLPLFLLRETQALRVLLMDFNRLHSLPFLKKAERLVVVSARFNLLTSLPILSEVPSLEYLFLRGNRLRYLKSADLLKAPALAFLDVSQNLITVLDRFYSHPGLMYVRMDINYIRDVTFVFRDLPRLQVLSLDSNSMKRLTGDMLPPSLRTLTLSFNLLTYIEPALIEGLPRLLSLTLYNNTDLKRLPRSSVQISPQHLPKPVLTVGPNSFVCDCQMAYLKAWAMLKNSDPSSSSSSTSSSLLAQLPDFAGLQELVCHSPFSGEDQINFEDVPLSAFVCPLKEALCDDSCSCCDPDSHTAADANCTCLLTCPDNCTCFHGGSQHIQLYLHVLCDLRNLTRIPDLIPSRATHVRLDGNRFRVLTNTTVPRIAAALFLYLNSSGIDILDEGCFEGLRALRVLDLSGNRIGRIEDATFGSLPALEELRLQRNAIRFIQLAAFSGLGALKTLSLHDNLLERVDVVLAFPSTAALSLAGNPWICDCDLVDVFLKFLISHRDNIVDYASLRCVIKEEDEEDESSLSLSSHNGTVLHTLSTPTVDDGKMLAAYINHSSVLLSEFQVGTFCRSGRNSSSNVLPATRQARVSRVMLHAIVGVVVVVVVAVVAGVVGVCWRAELQAWVYVRLGVRVGDRAPKLDRQEEEEAAGKNKDNAAQGAAGVGPAVLPKVYDAFVSYSHQDDDFVVNTLVPRLEQQGPRRYRLCVHYRDFPVGECIADTITTSVERSQRTLLILSRHFLDSEWCRFEFRTAHQHVLQQGGHRLVMVLLEDLPEQQLDDDLRVAMKTRTYLTTKDPWFWEKLYFAMPDLPCRRHDDQNGRPVPEHQPPPPTPPPPPPLQPPPPQPQEDKGEGRDGRDSPNPRENHLQEPPEPHISRDDLAGVGRAKQPQLELELMQDVDIKRTPDPTPLHLNTIHLDTDSDVQEDPGDALFALERISVSKEEAASTISIQSQPEDDVQRVCITPQSGVLGFGTDAEETDQQHRVESGRGEEEQETSACDC